MNPKTLLDYYKISPRKTLGQNFLHDPGALEKITSTAALTGDEIVLEIGPGTGTLTKFLARAARKVIAVEVDERLKPILEIELADYPNVQVIYRDFLEVDITAMMQGQDYVVVANVPYYITSAIVKRVLEADHKPRCLVMTVQHEVAERFIAQPDDMSLLSVSVQFYGNPRITGKLKPATFWPRPEVDSAVVRIDVYEKPPVEIPDEKLFFQVVRAGFSQKRKQLKNSLGGGLGIKASKAALLLEQAGIEPRRRAETLTLEEWAALTRIVAAN